MSARGLTLCGAHRKSAMEARAIILCREPASAAANRSGPPTTRPWHQRVEQRLDVAVAIGEGDTRGVVAVDLRHVVGHQHVGVADIAIGGERAGHVDFALVGNASMKSSFLPLMLRKCTLKILPRSPNQRITSKISRAGSSSISATVPWQKLSP